MTDRDPRCQRRRRGGARLSDADSHSPEAVGVGEHMYGSPIRALLTAAASTSFVPTPRVEARIGNPFVDPNQVPVLNQDAGLQAPHARDTSGAGGVNTAFWNTFGPFMAYNANLIMSALGSMQQSTLHPTPHHIPHTAVVSTPPRTVEPQAQATAQQSGGRILPWSEPEVAVRDKSLIEPEGDTFKPYKGVTNRIGEIMKGKFPGAWPNWGEVPIQQRDLWFAEFKAKWFHLKQMNAVKQALAGITQVRRNFDVSRVKQLKNLFAYARKLGKRPDWVFPDNWAQLLKYWAGTDFQKLSAQNKKNRSSDPEGVGPSLHTCGSIPITERRRRLAVSLEREPTLDELYKDTHMHRKKDNQDNWVCKKSELRLDEHLKRWHEYSKGCVYGFGAEGVLMKQRSRLSASTRSSSVHNYDAREMAMRLNESVAKAAEEARQAEEANHKEIEDLRHELAQEKAARQRDKEKVKTKLSKLWKFFKSQQVGSSTAPPQDDDEDEPDPSHLGDSSED
ncbi:hypothetical protein Cgig2_019890 [Carnegiea gigantea]|uniref:Uncharacterized protein n=1 Tax=Carnegiea gigantea TaxID=171969 RepID=A0A9Q1KKG5_9CARY|nr:hypothetical protein Cgig2_019890 [Carnegiea gigantea]